MADHHLPKHCYFNAFSTSTDIRRPQKKFVWVHEAGREPEFRNINAVAAENNLYTFYDEGGNPDKDVEIWLAKWEDATAPLIHRLIDEKGDNNLSVPEKFQFAFFVAMMRVRSPAYRDQLQQVAQALKIGRAHV